MRSSILITARQTRVNRALILSVVAIMCLQPRVADAQSARERGDSPAQDLIARAKDALNNLQYNDAIDVAKTVLQQPRLRNDQRVAAMQVVAAAYFPNPEDGAAFVADDSAKQYLSRAIRLRPDLPLALDVRWPGLDSLFRVVREQTFSSIAIPPDEVSLSGTDGRGYIEVVSTRPATMRLFTAPRGSTEFVQHDSSSASERARLSIRAHDGEQAVLAIGEHMLLIEVADAVSSSRDTLRFRVTVLGDPAPVLAREPVFDATRLLPERRPRKLGVGIASALFFGGATIALAQFARAREPIPGTFPADGRSRVVGLALGAGAIVGGLADKGVPLPANVAANTILKAQHAEATRDVQDANRGAVAAYRLSLRIVPEDR